jgi:hypothetical protein
MPTPVGPRAAMSLEHGRQGKSTRSAQHIMAEQAGSSSFNQSDFGHHKKRIVSRINIKISRSIDFQRAANADSAERVRLAIIVAIGDQVERRIGRVHYSADCCATVTR